MNRLPLLLGVLTGALVVLIVQQVTSGSSSTLLTGLAGIALGLVSFAMVRRRH